MTDLEDCARFLAEIAPKPGREILAVTTIDDYLIRNGDSRGELLAAFESHGPPDTSVTKTIRSKLDRLSR